jgi:hypothetical protein
VARPRTQAATPRKRQPAKRQGTAKPEQGARELRVDPGPAPALEPDEPTADELDGAVDDPRPELPPSLANVVDVAAELELETVEMLLGFVLLVFHWTLGRGGPPDAYVADDAELRQMARPATRVLNRSERARALAKHGDGLAFAMTFGGFVIKETEEVARWRSSAPESAAVDEDVAGVGVREHAADDVSGPVRRWRPPTVPPSE